MSWASNTVDQASKGSSRHPRGSARCPKWCFGHPRSYQLLFYGIWKPSGVLESQGQARSQQNKRIRRKERRTRKEETTFIVNGYFPK